MRHVQQRVQYANSLIIMFCPLKYVVDRQIISNYLIRKTQKCTLQHFINFVILKLFLGVKGPMKREVLTSVIAEGSPLTIWRQPK